jgi:hypothetical protein
LAFPFGDYGQNSVNMDKNATIQAYLNIVASIYPLSFELNFKAMDFNNYHDSNPNLLKRYEILSHISSERLVADLARSKLKVLPYVVYGFTPEEISKWFCAWGSLSLENSSMKLLTAQDQSGGLTLLYGGHYWKDYSIQAELSVRSGSAFVIARYVDENDYFVAGIDRGTLILRQRINGDFSTIASADLGIPVQAYRIILGFKDNTVTCEIDNRLILEGKLDPGLAQGGVGFQAWTYDTKQAEVLIKTVSICKSAS